MEYKILTTTDKIDHLELGRLVTNHCKKGWHLYGPMSTSMCEYNDDIHPVFAQAMIKEVQPQPAGEHKLKAVG